MSYYQSTEDYDISSSYLGDKINKDDKPSSPPSSDTGRDENERGHTNFEQPQKTR